jgi:ubiquinone/menaquinone biosynthesis C-methylase UbiE/dienelactone hydrolase
MHGNLRPGPAEVEKHRGGPEKPKALIVAPPSPELDVVLDALGGGWDLAIPARAEELDAIDPKTRLVVLDDRLPGSVVALARTALERSRLARVVIAAGPESMGEILSAGLDGARVAWLFRPLTAEAIAAELREVAGAHEHPESERRAFPRAALEEPKVVSPAGVDLRDISPGGALLVAPPGWTVGSRIQLELRLTSGAPVQRVMAEVTRTEPAPLGRLVVAARFAEPTARFQSLVRATILEHMTYSELRKLFRRFREDRSGCAPIVEAARVEALLHEFREHERSCLVSVPARGHPWRSAIGSVDAAARRLSVGRSGGGRRVHPGDGIEVFVNCSAESYLFEVQVLEVGETEISCTWPDVLHYSEKRTNKRRVVPAQAGAVVEIDAPPPWGTRSWPVRDLSNGGLSFVVPASEAVLLPGTPLRALRLRVGERTMSEHVGEVRHVAPLGDGTVLVGVGLLDGPRARGVDTPPQRPSPSASLDAARRARPRATLPHAPETARRPPVLTPLPHALGTAKRRPVFTPLPHALEATKRADAAYPVTHAPEAATRPPAGGPVSPPGGRRVRFFNSRKEVVSAILDTSFVSDGRFSAPVVIVAPSFGRSKECFSTLAHWLCDRFARLGQPVAVLRFDFTHSKGESFIPERNRAAGRECLDFTLSSALDDLRAAIRFVHHTPLFDAARVVVVGYSMSAPLALRAAGADPRVSHVVSVMGVPSFQDAVRNTTGGLDYVAGHLKGERHGIVNLLGHLVDMDELCGDAVASKLATARDTQRDIATLPPWVQVSWLVGQHDGWVDERGIEHLLQTKRRGARPDLVVLPTGHVPTVSDEAAAVAEETTRLVWRTVHGGEIPPGAGPDPETLERIAREEWAKAPRAAMADRRAYWADYLLGSKGELGFDVLEWVGAYRDLMAVQVGMLDARPGHVVLDAGGGTGNFLAALLEAGSPLPGRVEIADLVPEALERARAKNRAAADRAGLPVDYRVKTLEVSRLRPVERFVRGEAHGPEWLRGRIAGLDDGTLDRILELYGPSMHGALRGGEIDRALAHALSEHERGVVEEFGRAARLVLGRLRDDDFRPDCAAARPLPPGSRPVRTSHLRFDHLVFGDAGVDEQLAFESDAYDRIVASLLLPYLANPDETVRELHRALKPGGRLVISSNRPNTDMSEIFTKLVEDVGCGRVPPPSGMDRAGFLDALRAYTNSAAFLLRLTEEQTFRFFGPDHLRRMLEQAGFRGVEVRPSFGDPPQAFVAAGLKP